MWRESWRLKEEALRTRFARNAEALNRGTRDLHPLNIGSRCLVQNQNGVHPRKWDRSGVVMEILPHDQYTVRIDGSRRLTRRNRRFLRSYHPASTSINARPHLESNPCFSKAQEEYVPTGLKCRDRPIDTIEPANDCSGGNDNNTNPDVTHSADPPEPDVPFVAENNDTLRDKAQTSITAERPGRKEPRMLKNLRGFNKPGRLECEVSGKRHARK